LPSLERLYQYFQGKPFVIIGIDIEEGRGKVSRFLKKQGITYPNLLDTDARVSMLYRVRSTPTKFLINKKGRIIGFTLGYREWDTDEMKRLIELLIEG
jgi:cytochrome c-type biogenesis protein